MPLLLLIILIIADTIIGRIIPPNSMAIPGLLCLATCLAILNFFMWLRTGRGLVYHLQNGEQ